MIAPEKPFFLYYAPGAAHAPHHVFKEWADKYKGRFDTGYEAMRVETLARQKELGIVPADTEIPPINPIGTSTTRTGPDGIPFPPLDETRPWDSLSDEERRLFARMAEVYAGFVSHADHHIGRLLDYLEDTGQLENTLVMVVSDNGASGEGGPNGSVNEMKFANGIPDTVEANLPFLDELGGTKTYNHYPNGWAMAFNTPFKMWKRYEFNGGTSDPCIISWPAGIKAKGELRHQYHHAIDLVPTVLDCLGVEPPERIKGHVQVPFDGVSMRYGFDDADAPTTRRTQFYSMLGSRGIWHDGWKAITTHPTIAGWSHFNDDEWELYHTEVDRAEIHNLADEHPDKVRELASLWFSEAGANNAFPLDDRSALEIMITPRPVLVASARPVHLLPRHGGGARIAGGERPQPVVLDRGGGRHPGGGRGGRAVRTRVALRRPCPLRQGQPAALRLQLRRDAGAEDRRQRGRADRREAAPLRVVRQGRRGSAARLHRDPVALPRRQEGRGGADQDAAREVHDRRRGTLHRARRRCRRDRRLPRRAAVAIHGWHDPARRGGCQRRAVHRPGA